MRRGTSRAVGKPKRHRRYVRVPRRSRLPVWAAAVTVTAMLTVSVWGVSVVDRNSSAVGWDRKKTEFAFAVQRPTDRLSIVVLGREYLIPLARARRTVAAAARAKEMADPLKPVMLRGGQMLSQYAMGKTWIIRRAFDTLRSQAGRDDPF